MGLGSIAEGVGRAFEFAGIVVMVLGTLIAFASLATDPRGQSGRTAFQRVRRKLGAAILLGLELLIAADVIDTLTHEPSIQSLAPLGLIVLIRTFLSFTLEVEMEGTWPWRRSGVER